MSYSFMRGRKGGTIASASTITPDGTGDRYDVSGTTGITQIDTTNFQIGARFWLRFLGVLTLTYDGTKLITNSSGNITTAAGDAHLFEVIGANEVQQLESPGTGASGAMHLIASQVLGSNAATVEFVSIPTNTFSKLIVEGVYRGTRSNDQCNCWVNFNSDTGNNYLYEVFNDTPLSADSEFSSGGLTERFIIGTGVGAYETAGCFSSGKLEIYNPNSASAMKTLTSQGAQGGTTYYGNTYAGGSWQNDSDAITDILITPDDNDFIAGTVFNLYGVD